MKLKKQHIPFTQVANEVLQSTELSLKAKGLYAYMFSKPQDWQFSAQRIGKDCGESKPTVLILMKELEDHCLLTRHKLSSGRVEHSLTHSVCEIKVDERSSIKKKHVEKMINDVVEAKEAQILSPVNMLIEIFKGVNPSYARLFANTTQRAAVDRLVKQFGVDHSKRIIEYAVKVNGQPYAPVITTPVELEHKLGKLISYGKQQKAKGPMLVHI